MSPPQKRLVRDRLSWGKILLCFKKKKGEEVKIDNKENIAYSSVGETLSFLGGLDEVIDNFESEGKDLENTELLEIRGGKETWGKRSDVTKFVF